MATLEDFRKLDLRIGRIVEVQDHPNADKLYILNVDLGSSQKRIVAGIRSHYTKESLQGKQCVLVDNLEPATIRGVESQGMLLAAKDTETLTLLTVDREVVLGSSVS